MEAWPKERFLERPRSACAVEAVRIPIGTQLSDLAAMSYQEAAGTGEFIGLSRQHPNGQLFVRQVRARKLECFRGLRLVFVDLPRVLIVAASLELFDAVFVQFFIGLARGVVIGRHLCLPGLEKPRSSSDSCAVISHESTDTRAMYARARYNAITCRKFPLHGGCGRHLPIAFAGVVVDVKSLPSQGSTGCLTQGWTARFPEVRTAARLTFIPAHGR